MNEKIRKKKDYNIINPTKKYSYSSNMNKKINNRNYK